MFETASPRAPYLRQLVARYECDKIPLNNLAYTIENISNFIVGSKSFQGSLQTALYFIFLLLFLMLNLEMWKVN